jgi:hypothetical protein
MKEEIQAIAERIGVVEDWANGHRGHRETWLNALAKAHAALLNHLKAEQDKQAAVEAQAEQELVQPYEPATVSMIDIEDKETLATVFYSQIQDNGGTTLWLDQQERKTGFVVGNNTYSYQIPNFEVDRAFNYDRFEELVEGIGTFFVHAEYINNSGQYGFDGLGAWLDTDTNTLYLDLVRHIGDLGDALELALANEELAIYAIASGICYNVYGGHNKIDDGRFYVDSQPSELSDNFYWYRVLDIETDGVVGYVPSDE